MPVEWFGLAVEAERTRLPQRWTSLDSAGEDVEPSDLELAWVVHALEHEVARATGAELKLLVECWGIDLPVPAGAVHAAEQGQTLVPWCSGPSWHWHSETVAGPFIDRRRSRMDLTYSGECRVRRRSGGVPDRHIRDGRRAG